MSEEFEEYEKWCHECCMQYCGDDYDELMGEELCPGCQCIEMCGDIRYELGEDVDDDCGVW